jgi:hypothetical protein
MRMRETSGGISSREEAFNFYMCVLMIDGEIGMSERRCGITRNWVGAVERERRTMSIIGNIALVVRNFIEFWVIGINRYFRLV